MLIVIVEDEPVIAQRLQRQLTAILADHQPRLKHFDNLFDAESYIAEHPIDLMMLDLNLHGADGFDLLRQVSASSFHTIIVSAYADKAIQAFEFGVLDFVAKPFNQARLEKAIERFLDSDSRADYGLKQLAVKKPSGLQLVDVGAIQYIKADGHYTQLFMREGEELLHDKSIDKLMMLLPQTFERIHRSYIVNMTDVRSISVAAGGSYQAVLAQELRLPISRSRYAVLRHKLT